jgi:hypothetical protein
LRPDGSLKLLSDVRDLPVLDCNDRSCGICDDIELEEGTGGTLEIRALLLGPGAFAQRLPRWAGWVVRLVAGNRAVHVPWSEIRTVTNHIRLKNEAGTYGLLRLDDRLARYLRRLPAC